MYPKEFDPMIYRAHVISYVHHYYSLAKIMLIHIRQAGLSTCGIPPVPYIDIKDQNSKSTSVAPGCLGKMDFEWNKIRQIYWSSIISIQRIFAVGIYIYFVIYGVYCIIYERLLSTRFATAVINAYIPYIINETDMNY